MRKLTANEKNLIINFASHLKSKDRESLLSDLEVAVVKSEAPAGGGVSFEIQGYIRPVYRGQHSYGVEGEMLDQDDVKLSVLLFADEYGRLLELEFLRWDGGLIIGPKWETLKVF